VPPSLNLRAHLLPLQNELAQHSAFTEQSSFGPLHDAQTLLVHDPLQHPTELPFPQVEPEDLQNVHVFVVRSQPPLQQSLPKKHD
jgi:hypothetical protein